MIFVAPELDNREREVLEEIHAVRQDLRHQLAAPRRWSGSLRRVASARAVQGSNSIEGYDAGLDDIVAIQLDEEPLDTHEETHQAVRGYRDAMTYVVQIATDPNLVVEENLIKSLHFMMMSYDLTKWPGRWRPGSVFVERELDQQIVYEGPPPELVPELMSALVDEGRTDEGDPIVKGAMAHLNLAMIHPFRDGNGRTARCLQTLVLALDGVLEPPFASIEEYLGRNTQAYYEVLAEVGQGTWHPSNDARPWIRFCLTAHLRQVRTLQRRTEEAGMMWAATESLIGDLDVPERSLPALYLAAKGLRLRNSLYRNVLDELISDAVASRDLKALVDAGILSAVGEKRGRHYLAGDSLRAINLRVRQNRPTNLLIDPFV